MSGAALLCWATGPDAAMTVPVTFWASSAEALEALVELTPCSTVCEGRHTVVAVDARGRIRCRSFGPLPDDSLTTYRRSSIARARARLTLARAENAAQQPADAPSPPLDTDGPDCVETQPAEEQR